MRCPRYMLVAGVVAAIGTSAPREGFSQNQAPTAIPLPSGAYLIVLTNADPVPAGMVGEYRMVFDTVGGFRVVRNGNDLVVGKYTVRADTLTFVDVSGEMACRGAPEATYLWKLGDNGLELVAVSDACEGRRRITTIHPLARAKTD